MASKHDPKAAMAMADRTLVRENPAWEDVELETQCKLSELMLELGAADIAVSSLTEEQWRQKLLGMGLDADQVATFMEDIAQWGVTDEV